MAFYFWKLAYTSKISCETKPTYCYLGENRIKKGIEHAFYFVQRETHFNNQAVSEILTQ